MVAIGWDVTDIEWGALSNSICGSNKQIPEISIHLNDGTNEIEMSEGGFFDYSIALESTAIGGSSDEVDISVSYCTFGINAEASLDYLSHCGEINFSSIYQRFRGRILTIDDFNDESKESFGIRIFGIKSPNGPAKIGASEINATILASDNDFPTGRTSHAPHLSLESVNYRPVFDENLKFVGVDVDINALVQDVDSDLAGVTIDWGNGDVETIDINLGSRKFLSITHHYQGSESTPFFWLAMAHDSTGKNSGSISSRGTLGQ